MGSKVKHGVDAREIAARVLTRVLRDRAFASASLDAELEKHRQLSDRDKALATELVYGSLRTVRSLFAELQKFAPRGLPVDDWFFSVPLVIAAYQVLFLDRIPAFAAVNAAVEQIGQRRGKPLSGFANAVLRKLKPGTFSRADAIYHNAPEWLRERMEAAVGLEQARALLGASDTAASGMGTLGLRLKRGEMLPEELAQAVPSVLLEGAYRVKQSGDPRKLAGYTQGKFSVQEEGAQLIAVALGATPGERIWDACAGRGQKTALLAERVSAGNLWASDLHAAKLEGLQRELARMGLPQVAVRALDLSQGAGDVPSDFDRILVDAPCTGTGTLRRRPEILLRIEPTDPARLAAVSEQIMRTASTRLRVGGRMVFAVCSVLPEECEAVVGKVADILRPVPFDAPEVVRAFGEGTMSFRLLPGIHGTDGYYAASLSRA